MKPKTPCPSRKTAWLVVLFGVALAGCTAGEGGGAPALGEPTGVDNTVVGAAAASPAAAADSDTYRIAVEGMSCPIGCPPRVKAALRAIPGVTRVEVDFDAKTATVTCAKGTVAPKAFPAALARVGFTGTVR